MYPTELPHNHSILQRFAVAGGPVALAPANNPIEEDRVIRRFTRLFDELDSTTRTSEKLAALERYFREAPSLDAAWALSFLTGRRLKRAVRSRVVQEAIVEASGYRPWLIGECYEAVGDMSETMTLLLPDHGAGTAESLAEVVERRLVPLASAAPDTQRAILLDVWSAFNERQRFVFHKLISGTFRVGVQQRLVVRALAAVADVDPAIMAHRLTGLFEPIAAAYLALLKPDGGDASADSHARPYPFFLASQLDAPPETLGDIRGWQIEWKWDGIRAQLIHRAMGSLVIWSRGEEVITHQFPEVESLGRVLPHGIVLDGEILAWRDERPLPFAVLQTRLGRKVAPIAQLSLFERDTVIFMAYDVLEVDAADVRSRPLRARRSMLEELIADIEQSDSAAPIRLSPLVPARTWADAAAFRERAREERGAEGLMLKHLDSPYGVGRVKPRLTHHETDDEDEPSGADPQSSFSGAAGESIVAHAAGWWKWKVDPFTVDAVLIYAQPGHGRRAGLFTDYTFAVWETIPDSDGARRLTPFCKAYSGLTQEEIEHVDSFVRRNTIGRSGPVRAVRPKLVFEIAFASIQESSRHKSGLAVRFPRIKRWRTEKPADEADTIETLHELLRLVQG